MQASASEHQARTWQAEAASTCSQGMALQPHVHLAAPQASALPGELPHRSRQSWSRAPLQTLPIGNNIYIIGGLTNAQDLTGRGNESQPVVLDTTVAYNTFTEALAQLADMPQPRCGQRAASSAAAVWGALWHSKRIPDHPHAERI